MDRVSSFIIQYNSLDLNEIKNLSPDIFITEMARTPGSSFNAADVADLVSKGMLVAGYLNISVFEENRSYSIPNNAVWFDQVSGEPDADAPDWLQEHASNNPVDPSDPTSLIVNFMDNDGAGNDNWRDVLRANVDEILDLGFNAIFVDDILRYFGANFQGTSLAVLAAAMVDLVAEISSYAKSEAALRGFDLKIIYNGAPDILTHAGNPAQSAVYRANADFILSESDYSNFLANPQGDGLDAGRFAMNFPDSQLLFSERAASLGADAEDAVNYALAYGGPIFIADISDDYDDAIADSYVLSGSNFDGSAAGNVPHYMAGSDGNDTIYGGAGADNLLGGSGDDTLYGNSPNAEGSGFSDGGDLISGGAGNDSIFGNQNNDILNGGLGNDTINGGMGADILDGGDGNDLLNGATGTDRMSGGKGNDTYAVDDINDIVVEKAGEGNDVVYSSVDIALSGNIETLILTVNAVQGFGDIADNQIFGNGNVNVLFGQGGTDFLLGLGGNDIFVITPENGAVDVVGDYEDGGTGVGDRIGIAGFGAGAQVVQVSTTSFEIRSADNSITQQFILQGHGGAALVEGDDYYFA